MSRMVNKVDGYDHATFIAQECYCHC